MFTIVLSKKTWQICKIFIMQINISAFNILYLQSFSFYIFLIFSFILFSLPSIFNTTIHLFFFFIPWRRTQHLFVLYYHLFLIHVKKYKKKVFIWRIFLTFLQKCFFPSQSNVSVSPNISISLSCRKKFVTIIFFLLTRYNSKQKNINLQFQLQKR